MLYAQLVLIAFFSLASSIKIFGWLPAVFEKQLMFFKRYGLNRLVMFLVGVIEAIGVILMILGFTTSSPIFNLLGAGLIAVTSIGAMFFHFRFDTWKDAIPSMVTLVLSSWVLFASF